ncbi:hypothetical protein P154DRAFT_576868 [Amniculicola lignicola CBS 123094]|uniref:Uncharacterized protein n=1 Tax=Amniculicola lignicola CBS 123094 TaxID=1392246 RepID=A0A6A5WCW6_9PLEO|nr:hypothetical protein P154DRAFT_576868 [Amniculicola lignicola CBS 123094]
MSSTPFKRITITSMLNSVPTPSTSIPQSLQVSSATVSQPFSQLSAPNNSARSLQPSVSPTTPRGVKREPSTPPRIKRELSTSSILSLEREANSRSPNESKAQVNKPEPKLGKQPDGSLLIKSRGIIYRM